MSIPTDPAPQWHTDYFRDAPARGHAKLGRGLIGHVPVVAWLMIVQGIMELLLGLFALSVAILILFVPDEAFSAGDRRMITIIYAIIAVPSLAIAALHIVAGIYSLFYRRRRLGITALAIGLASVLTGLCAPTGIALAIYGLIVFINDSVVAAFQMGDQGRSRAEINAAFPD